MVRSLRLAFCVQAQVAPQSVGVPLQSWDLSIRKAMAGASEGIQSHGIEVLDIKCCLDLHPWIIRTVVQFY